MKLIGIDIGTTTISAVVLDQEAGQVLLSRTLSNGSFIETENEWERIQDTGIIIGKARAVLDEFLQKFPDVSSIGLTGQMHGIVYLDADGKALSPLYTWQDGRGNEVLELIREKTGLSAAAGYGLVTHVYNCIHGLVPGQTAKIATIGDYLGMQLTGRREPLTHISNAAGLGFFDSRNLCFYREKLEAVGVSPEILPEVTDEFSVLGTYREIPVTASIGDNQASFLGSVGLQDNVILLNMGTGGQISVLSDDCFETPGIEARPLMKGKYLLAGSSLCGGRAYAILEKFLRSYVCAAGGKDENQYQIMARLAAKAAAAEAQKAAGQAENKESGQKENDRTAQAPDGTFGEAPMEVDTRFNGSRTNPSLRGSMTNLSENNFTPEGMIYGTLKGMSQELFDLYRLVEAGTGIHVRKLIASGNGYRKNPVLQQISREMFGAELVIAPYEEEAACGAAVSSRMR